ncbi:MAG: ATP-binding protein [Minisyncoccia bacterium]
MQKDRLQAFLKQGYDSGTFLRGLGLFSAILIGYELSFALSSNPAVFPLHAGIALAGLVLVGAAYWPAIFFATLTSHFLHETPAFMTLAYALGNSIQALTAVYILLAIQFKPSLRRMRDIFGLTLVALTVSTIAPSVRFLAYEAHTYLGGTIAPSVASFGSLWVGHIFSLLIVSPFLIRWLAHPHFKRTKREVLEIVLAMLSLSAVFVFLFFTPIEQINGIPLVYAIFPPLFWIALRLGSRFMTLALFSMSLIALTGTTLGFATDAAIPTGELLFLTEVFLEVVAVIFLIVTAVEEERRTATARLRGHIDDLEEALQRNRKEDDAKNTFVATLAHELRNPLAPLLSTIELLTLRGPYASDFPHMLRTMHDRVMTMSHLLDDLLDISRISHQKLELKKKEVDIVAIVQSSVQSMEGYIEKRARSFNVTLPHTEKLMLLADPIRIEQIVVNLLSNAAKYTPEGGTIDLTVARENTQVAIRVRDSGIGIPANMLTRIFEPFLQLNASQASGGLGIGLTLTQRLVEMHGGTIEARSAGEGHGSEFIVRLPLSTSTPLLLTAGVPDDSSTHIPTSLSKGVRLLLVDDNEAATMTLRKLLEFKGYEVRTASNAAEAFAAVALFAPHVIMLDIGLPGMDGYEIARRLRTEGCTAKIVALTGYGQSGDKERAEKEGFDHHLTKPVGILDLEKVLSSLQTETIS